MRSLPCFGQLDYEKSCSLHDHARYTRVEREGEKRGSEKYHRYWRGDPAKLASLPWCGLYVSLIFSSVSVHLARAGPVG